MKNNNIGAVALSKARELSGLISILNNTTIGSLNENVATNANAISILIEKMNTISSIFSIEFNIDGTLNTEAYHAHTHQYTDETIADTADGTGTTTNTTKTTQGVN